MRQTEADQETVERVMALLGEHGYAQGFAPIDEASGLPNVYWSPERIPPLRKRTAGYDFSTTRSAGRIDFDVKVNSKLVFENDLESGHVFLVHPHVVEFAPMNLCWSAEWQDHIFYSHYVFPKTTMGRGQNLPHYPGWSATISRPAFGSCVFRRLQPKSTRTSSPFLQLIPSRPISRMKNSTCF